MAPRLAPSPRPRPWRFLLTAATLCGAGQVFAQDVTGGSDALLVSRYQGSRLVAWKDDAFDSVSWPTAYDRDGGKWKQTMTIEGERQRRVYLDPPGRSGLEVQRNYEAALAAAGGTRLLGCAGEACPSGASDLKSDYAMWAGSPEMKPGRIDLAFPILNAGAHVSHAMYRITRAGRTSFVTVLTSEGAREGTGTIVDIVTPRPMDSGKVSVATAEVIGQGLRAEGRMAVYGVGFDTGKADIRPDSKAQLAEMAAVLKAQPALKVFIVGHTDNAGAVDANVALSQRRAEAIVAALARDFGISAARMQPRGVANFAPVAPNTTEEGRSRNRRVELVVQ